MSINFNTSIVTGLYTGSVANDAAYQSPGTYGIPTSGTTGALSSVSVTAAGTGYTTKPTFSATVGTGATFTVFMKVLSATVAAGGTGGTNGTQTVTGTTGTGTKFTASVTVSGGAITAVGSITVAGSYSVMPTTLTAEPVTGAGLTGATLSLVMGVASVTVTAGGTGYTVSSAGSFSGGGGSGATATVAVSNLSEQRMLCMIDLFASFVGSAGSISEVYAMRDILRLMVAQTSSIGGTFSASALKTKVQKIGVTKYITQPRTDM